MTSYIPVAGTWGFDDNPLKIEWWEKDSPFNRYVAAQSSPNCTILRPDAPFEWSTSLEGLPNWLGIFKRGKSKHIQWKAGARALSYYMKDVPLEDRNIIAHSHGGQVALYAASFSITIRTLITIGTPVRKDMQDVIRVARPFIGRWLHIDDSKSDMVARWGQLGDGQFFNWKYYFTQADRNDDVRDIHHSEILNNPAFFYLWQSNRWLEYLRG